MIVRLVAGIAASVLFASPVLAQAPLGPAPAERRAPAVALTAPASDALVLPSFGSLFRDLDNDVRQLPSRETALILGATGAASLAAHRQDVQVTRRVSNSRWLDTVFEPGEIIGGGVTQVGAAFATFAIGRLAKSPRVATIGADLVRAQILNAALTHGIKLSVGRTRPSGGPFSFPSGHTSSSFATAAVLQRRLGWRAGIPAYGLAAYIAGSRLQENKHYLSDVVFGAAVGIVSGRTVTIGGEKTRFAVSPFAAPGGGGVGFAWAGTQ